MAKPAAWWRTQAGSVPFCMREATSVSIATSATAVSAQRGVAAGPPVRQELLQLRVGGPHVEAQLLEVGDRTGVLVARQLLQDR